MWHIGGTQYLLNEEMSNSNERDYLYEDSFPVSIAHIIGSLGGIGSNDIKPLREERNITKDSYLK